MNDDSCMLDCSCVAVHAGASTVPSGSCKGWDGSRTVLAVILGFDIRRWPVQLSTVFYGYKTQQEALKLTGRGQAMCLGYCSGWM